MQLQVLIHTETAPMAWPDWLASAGCEGLRSERSLQFEEMYYAVEAAANGLGIALAPATLVADDVIAGRLALPFPHIYPRQNDYRTIYNPASRKLEAIERFCDWLGQEGQQSAAEVAAIFAASGGGRRAAARVNPSPRKRTKISKK
jgi:LysR family glycine cleavage system transcriptional activator